MLCLVLAIAFTLISPVVSFFIIVANIMSDSPSAPFQGGWVLLFFWGLTALFWYGWTAGW